MLPPQLPARLDTPNIRRVLVAGGVLGLLLGIETLVLIVAYEPIADSNHRFIDFVVSA